jgi:hypothetical protein
VTLDAGVVNDLAILIPLAYLRGPALLDMPEAG